MVVQADVTDLLAGWRHIRAPSGVTRVQTRLVQASMGLFEPVAFEPQTGTWRLFPRPMLDRVLIEAGEPGGPKDPGWQALVNDTEALLRAAPAWEAKAGDWLLGIGAGWWLPGHAARILALKRAGLAYANFVHDVLPLAVPEHCGADLVRSFTQHFATICLLADHAVCNSEASRTDFEIWQRRLLPELMIPASVLRLDAGVARPAAAAVRDNFVLAVGTVESRKNQLGLLRAWLRLIRAHGAAAVPRLVVVGLHGHLSEQVVQLREASPELRRHVDFRHALPDAELDALYAGCLFTVFNSHAEGWGLPVSESLAHGRVPLVADLPVLREAGGAHAVYVEADNVPALAAAAWALVSDPAGLQAREAAIHEAQSPSWRDLAERCAAFLQARPAPPLDRAPLPPGEWVPCGLPPAPDLPALPPAYAASGALLRQGDGWSHQEEWGCWAVAPGRVALRLPLDAGWRCPTVRLSLQLMGPPGGHVIRALGREWPVQGETTLELDMPWPAGGVLEVEFDVGDGVAVPPDHRMLGFGLRALSVSPRPTP